MSKLPGSPRNKRFNSKKGVKFNTDDENENKQVRKWTVYVELDKLMSEIVRIKDFIQKVKFSFERDHLENNHEVEKPSNNIRFEFTKTSPKS